MSFFDEAKEKQRQETGKEALEVGRKKRTLKDDDIGAEGEAKARKRMKGVGSPSPSSSSSSSSSSSPLSPVLTQQKGKWSHSILESWLETPWLTAEEASEFVKSLSLPTTRRTLIQETKAATALYRFGNEDSIFIKGPTEKGRYRERFSCQWLASALKSEVGDDELIPVIATRCMEFAGKYYLLMHDVSRTGARNVVDWLKAEALKNINAASRELRDKMLGTLVFRKTFCIGDTNFRNIMTNGVDIFSIDEESCLEGPGSNQAGKMASYLFNQFPADAEPYAKEAVARFKAFRELQSTGDVAAKDDGWKWCSRGELLLEKLIGLVEEEDGRRLLELARKVQVEKVLESSEVKERLTTMKKLLLS
jgi:hypothetical protein